MPTPLPTHTDVAPGLAALWARYPLDLEAFSLIRHADAQFRPAIRTPKRKARWGLTAADGLAWEVEIHPNSCTIWAEQVLFHVQSGSYHSDGETLKCESTRIASLPHSQPIPTIAADVPSWVANLLADHARRPKMVRDLLRQAAITVDLANPFERFSFYCMHDPRFISDTKTVGAALMSQKTDTSIFRTPLWPALINKVFYVYKGKYIRCSSSGISVYTMTGSSHHRACIMHDAQHLDETLLACAHAWGVNVLA